MINFVFSAVTPKMAVLECMYIKQAIDLLQVDKTSVFLTVILLFVLGCCPQMAVVTYCICFAGFIVRSRWKAAQWGAYCSLVHFCCNVVNWSSFGTGWQAENGTVPTKAFCSERASSCEWRRNHVWIWY